MEAEGSQEDAGARAVRLTVPSSHLPSLAIAPPAHKDDGFMGNRGGEGDERENTGTIVSFINTHACFC